LRNPISDLKNEEQEKKKGFYKRDIYGDNFEGMESGE